MFDWFIFKESVTLDYGAMNYLSSYLFSINSFDITEATPN